MKLSYYFRDQLKGLQLMIDYRGNRKDEKSHSI